MDEIKFLKKPEPTHPDLQAAIDKAVQEIRAIFNVNHKEPSDVAG